MPVKKADEAEIAERSNSIAGTGRLKKVSPPPCPEATRRAIESWDRANNKKKVIINPTAHLPKIVFGIKLNFIDYSVTTSVWKFDFYESRSNLARKCPSKGGT